MADGAVADTPSRPSWVGETLDGSGSWSLRSKAPWIIGLLMLFDSWDSTVIAYVLPVLRQQWVLDGVQSGAILSSGYAGQFFGALIFGWVAERYGRLPILRWLVLIMSLLGIACANAGSYQHLIVLRALQGLAIGGALPVAICYINEIAPTATRGRFFGTYQFLMTAGFGLAAFGGRWLIPAYGWPIMFALGAAPLLVLPFTLTLPESPRWLAGRGRADAAARALERLGAGAVPVASARAPIPGGGERVPFSLLFEPAVRKTFIVTALLWFLTSLVSFGMVSWVPSLYVTMFKVSIEESLRLNQIVALSIFILPLILRATIDRFGRRPPPLLGTAIGGLALVSMIFITVDKTALLVGLAIVGQIGVSIGSMVLWPYTAETYPTRIRSLVLGTSSSIARAASTLSPLLVGGVMQFTNGAVTPVFLVFGLPSLAVAMLWLFCVRETAGRKMVD